MFSTVNGMAVQPGDYDRWMDMHDEIKWTFARSMPGTPHYYMVKNKTVSAELYDLAFGVNRVWGEPGKFYSRTQLYLPHRDKEGVRYWLMDRYPTTAEILNMATDGKQYGVQDAPVTATDGWSEFDEIGAWWDFQYREVTESDRATLWKLVHGNIPVPKPSMIDIGAGTGTSIEAQAAASTSTLAIDPSRAMLNDLVLKFPQIKEVYPGTFQDWAEQADPGRQARDVVIASTGSASYLTPEEIRTAPTFARHLTLLSFYTETPTYRTSLPDTHEEALDTARSLPKAQSVTKGGWTYVAIP